MRHLHIKRVFVTGGKVIVSQGPFYLGLRSRYGDANAREHVVHQDIAEMALADKVPDEHAWHIVSLLDTP